MFAMKTAIEASEILLTYYQNGFQAEIKTDGSPVTNADLASSSHISKKLTETGIPVIEEESNAPDFEIRATWKQNWCVDPLDGTKEFIKQNGEFAINIALIEDGKPVFGLIAAPVEQKLLVGAQNWGVFILHFSDLDNPEKWQKIEPSLAKKKGIALIGSRSHHSGSTLDFINRLRNKNQELRFIKKGSSLKFFDLALEDATIYPRFAPTMEWDIAAGQAILEALGGAVLHADSLEPLTYNKVNLKNPYFIALTASFINQYGIPQ